MPRLIPTVLFAIFLGLCSGSTVTYGQASGSQAFSPEAWIQVPDQSPEAWDRSAMIERLVADHRLRGKSSEDVRQLLGPPNYHQWWANVSRVRKDSHRYIYFLSSDGRNVLTLDIDDRGIVTQVSTSALESHCPSSFAQSYPAAGRTLEAVRDEIRDESETSIRLSRLAQIVGRPGRVEQSKVVVANRGWVAVRVGWKLGDKPLRLLMFSERISINDWPDDKQDQQQEVMRLPVSEYAIVTLYRYCE